MVRLKPSMPWRRQRRSTFQVEPRWQPLKATVDKWWRGGGRRRALQWKSKQEKGKDNDGQTCWAALHFGFFELMKKMKIFYQGFNIPGVYLVGNFEACWRSNTPED